MLKFCLGRREERFDPLNRHWEAFRGKDLFLKSAGQKVDKKIIQGNADSVLTTWGKIAVWKFKNASQRVVSPGRDFPSNRSKTFIFSAQNFVASWWHS